MGKWLDGFLAFKNEADATRKFALFAVVIITLGLASLSVTGIVATADWSLLSMLPILGMIVAVLGAELLATVAFIRMLTASTRWRKVAGLLIFLGLAAVGVHNAENGAHVVWRDRFAVSSGKLSAQADLAGQEAKSLASAATTAATATPQELERVRTDIAKLESFLVKMSAQTVEGVKAAQSEMIGTCGYQGEVDGIRSRLTESAMRVCGEDIRNRLIILRQRETNLASGVSTPVQAASTDRSLDQIDKADQAAAAFSAWAWLIIMLCTLEGARSLSLWAFITDISATDAGLDRQRSDELAAIRHQNELAALLAQRVTAPAATPAPPVEAPPVAIPDPVEAIEPEPVPEPAPPPPERDPVNQNARNAAKSLHQMKRADKLEDVILVDDNRERDVALVADRMAAQ